MNVFSKAFIKNASYNKMKGYMYEHDTMVVTGDKWYRNSDKNKENEKELFRDLWWLCKEHGWKCFPTYGGYQEEGAKKPSNEHSFMIVNLNDDKDFREIVTDFMEQRNYELEQESIAYFPKIGEGEGSWDYLQDTEDNRKGDKVSVGTFHDKSMGTGISDEGKPFTAYTSPRRHNNRHKFAFAKDGNYQPE